MIDAMKQAIEALEPFSTYGRPGSRDVETYRAITAITALRAAIEAAERQTPVAWLVYAGLIDMHPVYPPYKNKEAAEIVASEIKSVTEVRPLYAHPPAITDDMVEQATIAYENAMRAEYGRPLIAQLDGIRYAEQGRNYARAALEAALGVKDV